MSAAPLYGVVLSGGRSQRMQRDKAALAYQGVSQLERTMALLESRVERAFVSVRAEQRDDPLRARYALIADQVADLGPAGGILAAQASAPGVAWLVLACDLPFLDAHTLDHLIGARQPTRAATAYRSSHDGLPEPLCAIYEPSSHAALAAAVAAGRNCPRKFLLSADTALLEPASPQALENINTPEQFTQATAALGTSERQVTVQYYALLREQAGRAQESLRTAATTAAELYGELRRRHPFTLPPELLRVAVNTEFAEWSAPLTDGDTVVFIPPVAGG